MPNPLLNVEQLLEELTLQEKISLLTGKDTWSTQNIERLDIPSITTTDGPHGARGTAFFNGPRGALLPSATAMGATFDRDLMRSVGQLLASETIEKGCQVLLAPTVCLQRSPLLGRGFEAFGEDPVLSGLMASEYIKGVQEHGVAVSIKHYAAHDQSTVSPEDNVVASERTLRETSLLPFQLAVKHANPWSFMSSYHRINGVHTPEDPWLNNTVLREEWGWNGLIMSDWFGMFSTAESINAGLDLEMPGPTRWRGELLSWALMSRKITHETLNERVRNVLNFINKVAPSLAARKEGSGEADTPEKRLLCRKVARSAIVLLKNDRKVLPLDATAKQTYALIGPGALYPAFGGGGSADLPPYYTSKPLEAIREVVGDGNLKTAIGCYSHVFTPLLTENIKIPGSEEKGYVLSWFDKNPDEAPETVPIHTTTTQFAQMYFADCLPAGAPASYWLRVETVYTPNKSTTVQLGLCVLGKGRLFVDGKEHIDLWTNQPKKTLQTPMFNQASMEVITELSVKAGQSYRITVLLRNESLAAGVGALNAGGLRIGCCEKIDPVVAMNEAVELARSVDVPIVIAGLNADYESEAGDRQDLELPPGVSELIERVVAVNPRAVIVNQSGCPVTMPFIDKVSTLVHAWYGGQETGNAIADVLFGKHNPSGRMSVTFPRRLEDTPSFLTFGKGTRGMYYGEGVFIGYRYYEKLRNDPLFYFGYGLSYTTFSYTNLQVPSSLEIDDGSNSYFEIAVDVTNTGELDGHEVIQVYISDVECDALRPRKELKGFARVWLVAGETKRVKIDLDKYALSFWSEEKRMWLAEKGVFKAIISRSADPADEVLDKEFELRRDYLWKGT